MGDKIHDTISDHDVPYQVHCVSVRDNDCIPISDDGDSDCESHCEDKHNEHVAFYGSGVDEPSVGHGLMPCVPKLE